MTFDWKTEMRKSDRGTGPDGLALGARTDGLQGQAAATVHDDGRVTLSCLPDAGCFPADATISADDARALCRALLDRLDHVDDLDARDVLAPDMRLRLVDLTEHGKRLYGDAYPKILPPGMPVPEHDWRFELRYGGTGRVGIAVQADATHVAMYVQNVLKERARRAADEVTGS